MNGAYLNKRVILWYFIIHNRVSILIDIILTKK